MSNIRIGQQLVGGAEVGLPQPQEVARKLPRPRPPPASRRHAPHGCPSRAAQRSPHPNAPPNASCGCCQIVVTPPLSAWAAVTRWPTCDIPRRHQLRDPAVGDRHVIAESAPGAMPRIAPSQACTWLSISPGNTIWPDTSTTSESSADELLSDRLDHIPPDQYIADEVAMRGIHRQHVPTTQQHLIQATRWLPNEPRRERNHSTDRAPTPHPGDRVHEIRAKPGDR